jgi:hypothetical protein
VNHALATAFLQNLWIGIAYIAAASAVVLFALKFGRIAAGWLGPPPILFPACLMVISFLAGCGGHHLDLAYLAAHGITGHHAHVFSQVRPSAMLFNWMQVVGAPGFVFLAWWLYVVVSRKLTGDDS